MKIFESFNDFYYRMYESFDVGCKIQTSDGRFGTIQSYDKNTNLYKVIINNSNLIEEFTKNEIALIENEIKEGDGGSSPGMGEVVFPGNDGSIGSGDTFGVLGINNYKMKLISQILELTDDYTQEELLTKSVVSLIKIVKDLGEVPVQEAKEDDEDLSDEELDTLLNDEEDDFDTGKEKETKKKEDEEEEEEEEDEYANVSRLDKEAYILGNTERTEDELLDFSDEDIIALYKELKKKDEEDNQKKIDKEIDKIEDKQKEGKPAKENEDDEEDEEDEEGEEDDKIKETKELDNEYFYYKDVKVFITIDKTGGQKTIIYQAPEVSNKKFWDKEQMLKEIDKYIK